MAATSVTDNISLLLWPHYFIIHCSERERERERERELIQKWALLRSFFFFSFFLSSRLTALTSHVILNEWLYNIFLIGFCLFVCLFACLRVRARACVCMCVCVCFHIHRSGALTAIFGCYMAGASWNCCCLGARSGYTLQLCNSLQCHFIRSYICWVHICLAVTCRLHFWQNDRYLLRAIAVTRG